MSEAVPDTAYWSAVVDMSEHVEGLPEALDHDDDSHSSSSSSSDEEGPGPSRRLVAARLDQHFLETFAIGN